MNQAAAKVNVSELSVSKCHNISNTRASTMPLMVHGDACRQELISWRADGSGDVTEKIVTRFGDRFDLLTNLGRRVRLLELFESSLATYLAGSEYYLAEPPP